MSRLIDRQEAIGFADALRLGGYISEKAYSMLKEYVENVDSTRPNISVYGTLIVTVPEGTEVKRVLVQEQGTRFGGTFYLAKRKKGKWIDETFKSWGLVFHPYKCDQCGEHSEADSDYCPNCGARMRGEDDV